MTISPKEYEKRLYKECEQAINIEHDQAEYDKELEVPKWMRV